MATQKVVCSYQEIIDLHTESDKVSVIGIHTPTGDTPHKMFKGFFDQFKKFKYAGCSISLVPAARLPVDPLQVSYEPGEPTIDPRDTLNPIMWHGAHGEDLGDILNSLYSFGSIVPAVGQVKLVDEFAADSVDLALFANQSNPLEDMTILEKLYYKALTDNSWKKAHPQRGFRKSGLRPMVYNVTSSHQIMPNTSMDDLTLDGLDDAALLGFPTGSIAQGAPRLMPQISKASQNFYATRLTGLGWMDTRTPLGKGSYSAVSVPSVDGKNDFNAAFETLYGQNSHLTELGRHYMGLILLPPAYKTEQFFRLIINHNFLFAKFRSISFQNDVSEDTPSYFNWNDEISNDLNDDNGGGSDPEEPTITLGSEKWIPFTPGVSVDTYSSITYNGVSYSPQGSGSYTNVLFAVYEGTLYIGIYDGSSMKLLTSSSGDFIGITASDTTTEGQGSGIPAALSLSPTNADLLADLIDGGIDLGE